MTPKLQYSEPELVALLQQKDQRAYNYLYDNYANALYGVIHKIIRDADEAADILQDAFVKIWRNIEHYDADKGKLFTWMLNITRNMAIDFIRSAQSKNDKKTETLTPETALPIQDFSSQIKTDHLGLSGILNELKAEHKAIIDLAYFKGYTQEEISKELDVPLGTVKTRARSALSILKNFFN